MNAALTAFLSAALLTGTLAPAAAEPVGSHTEHAAVSTSRLLTPHRAARAILMVRIGSSSFPLAGTNLARQAHKVGLYRAPRKATPKSRRGVDVVVVRGRVAGIKVLSSGRGREQVMIPAGGYVLSGKGAAARWLRSAAQVGRAVSFGTRTTPSGRVVRVMPMGDSLTQAGGTAMGFKGYLLDKLLAAGEKVDYVGSQVATAPATLRDRDHEGHSGWQNSSFQPTAGGFVSAYQPEVVIYDVGANDIWSNIDADTAVTRLRDVLTKIYAAKSGTHVVLAELVRMNVGKDAEWRRYNDQIPGVVREFKSHGKRISLADLSATLTTADLQGDGVHPTDAGHRKMANAFYPIVKAAIDSVR